MEARPEDAAVALLSGGLDSSVAMALHAEQHSVVLALTVHYGQKAAPAECRAAAAVAGTLQVTHRVLQVDVYRDLGGAGALLESDVPVPEPSAEQVESAGAELEETAAQVWVPNRNGLLIQLAAASAESLGVGRVVVGFNREEAVTFADNRSEFLLAASEALRFSTRNQVQVVSPTIAMDKAEILAEALRMGLDPHTFWSCYRDGAAPCGRCESCRRMARAARQNGVSGDLWGGSH